MRHLRTGDSRQWIAYATATGLRLIIIIYICLKISTQENMLLTQLGIELGALRYPTTS